MENERLLEELNRKATAGDVEAQYQLASVYDFGYQRSRNLKRAIYWYEKAVEGDHIKAAVNLGYIYVTGHWRIGNIKRGLNLWKKSAQKKDVKALFNLGYCEDKWPYEEGKIKIVYKYYHEAAKFGDAYAQGNLGRFLYRNCIDREKGIYWLRQAASQNLPTYQYCLANALLDTGQVDEAILWYEKAALQGIEEAGYNLALVYLLGYHGQLSDYELGWKYLKEYHEYYINCHVSLLVDFEAWKRKQKLEGNNVELLTTFCRRRNLKVYLDTDLHTNLCSDFRRFVDYSIRLRYYPNDFYLEDIKQLPYGESCWLHLWGNEKKLIGKYHLKDYLIELQPDEFEGIKGKLYELRDNYISFSDMFTPLVNQHTFSGSVRIFNSIEDYFNEALLKVYQYYLQAPIEHRCDTKGTVIYMNPVFIKKDKSKPLDVVYPVDTDNGYNFHYVFEEEHLFIKVDETHYYYYQNPKYYGFPSGFSNDFRVKLQGIDYYDEGLDSSYFQSLLIDELFAVYGYKFIKRKREEALKSKNNILLPGKELVTYEKIDGYCVIEVYHSKNQSITIYKFELNSLAAMAYSLNTIAETWKREKVRTELDLRTIKQIIKEAR